MLTVLLFAVIGFIAGYLGFAYDKVFSGFLFSVVGTAVGFLFSALVLPAIFTTPDDFTETTTERKLIALDSDVATTGSFFLGTGSVDGVKRYYYFVKTERGIHSRSVDANDSYIVEHDNIKNPRIVRHDFDAKSNLFYLPMNKNFPEAQDYHRIHIPEGSIKREYNPN